MVDHIIRPYVKDFYNFIFLCTIEVVLMLHPMAKIGFFNQSDEMGHNSTGSTSIIYNRVYAHIITATLMDYVSL